jgi:D-alanyl-D-alanine carboxypeptidase
LLGVIVEKVSGQNYYDYVRDHIFKPAGMIATASEPEDQVVADRSVGYMRSGGTVGSATLTHFPIAGLLRVAVIRRLRIYCGFATALQTNKLLKPQYTEMLTTGKVETPNGGKYAYGFQEATVNGTPMLRPWRWRARDEWRVEDLPWARLCGCCVGELGSASGDSSCRLHY